MKVFRFLIWTFVVAIGSCARPPQIQDPIPTHETFSLQSKILGEKRTITIWMPENYSTQTDSLPVLYMADGGVKEDFPHIANTLDSLIKQKKIPPMLLVGIENTQRRRDLTGFTEVESDKKIAPVVGGSDKFRAFIKEELFPEITNRYRTTAQKSIIGESAAGLFVIETLLLEPDLFDNYIAFDPSLWWNNNYLVTNVGSLVQKLPLIDKKLWFAGSNAADIQVHTRALDQSLQKLNLSQLHYTYADEPELAHNTIFRATKEKALLWTFSSH